MDTKKITLLFVFLVMLEVRFIYIPAKKNLVSLNELIMAKKKDRDTLVSLCEEYRKRKKEKEPPRIARKEFSLLSYTVGLIEKKDIKGNITGLQPLKVETKGGFSVESIRIGIEGITLQQLYEFLSSVEKSSEGIYISEFRMERKKDQPHLLGVELELFVMKEMV